MYRCVASCLPLARRRLRRLNDVHAVIADASTPPAASMLLWCLLQHPMATQGRGALRPIAVPVLEACVRDALNFNPKCGAGENGFAAMQRLIDRKAPGCRA
jgi:hypothetical protein